MGTLRGPRGVLMAVGLLLSDSKDVSGKHCLNNWLDVISTSDSSSAFGIVSEFSRSLRKRCNRAYGPFWVRVGVRVRLTIRGWVGSTSERSSHQDVLPSRQNNAISGQPTPVKTLTNRLRDEFAI